MNVTLANYLKLLEPGRKLVISELTWSQDCTSLTFGTLPRCGYQAEIDISRRHGGCRRIEASLRTYYIASSLSISGLRHVQQRRLEDSPPVSRTAALPAGRYEDRSSDFIKRKGESSNLFEDLYCSLTSACSYLHYVSKFRHGVIIGRDDCDSPIPHARFLTHQQYHADSIPQVCISKDWCFEPVSSPRLDS